MLRCCAQCVEIYTEQRTFKDGFDFCFHLKKTAAESYRLRRGVYGGHAQSQDSCARWFRHFKGSHFGTRQEGRQGTWKIAKKFENVELQGLLEEVISKHKNNSPSN